MPEVRLSVAGDAYRVRCDDETIAGELSRWSTLLRTEAVGSLAVSLDARAQTLAVDGQPARSFRHREQLLPALEGVFYDRLRRPERGLTVLHGAVAAFRGRAALFLGDSGAGKSVLSLDLCERGWTYLSDELAPIDSRGQVLALPRPVSFDGREIEAALWERLTRQRESWSVNFRAGDDLRTSRYVLPERAAPSGAAFPIGAVFRLEPRRGNRPRLRRLSSVEARSFLAAARALAPVLGQGLRAEPPRP